MFAKFSPDGYMVAYVREQNIYVEDIASTKIVQLTSDGLGNIINGTSDWVYEEEFGLRNGFRVRRQNNVITSISWLRSRNITLFFLDRRNFSPFNENPALRP